MTPAGEPERKGRYVVGCMTGTSIDALDVALVECGDPGLSMSAGFVRGLTRPLGPLADPLRALADQRSMTAGQIATLARDFALLHVEAIRELLGADEPLLIAIHGQTVYHAPPVSWQFINPAPIAQAFQTTVVSDLRAADLAAGGQGAPLTPLADYVLFRSPREARAVVNLGGFCNVTLLPPATDDAAVDVQRIGGGDVCACNHVLDGVARRVLGAPFDEGGQAAAAGAVDAAAFEALQILLAAQRRPGRSLGTGDEVRDWIERFAGRCAPSDLARTACEAVAATIAAALRRSESPPARVLLAGGGVHNATLCDALSRACGVELARVDAFGVPAAFREAAAMAVLGRLALSGVPIALPQITGATTARRAGVWSIVS